MSSNDVDVHCLSFVIDVMILAALRRACLYGLAGLSGCMLPHLLVDGKSFKVDPTICLTFPCSVAKAECGVTAL
jgi:hypothetical protein